MGSSGERGVGNPKETFGQALAAAVGSSFIWDCFGADVQRVGWMGFFDKMLGMFDVSQVKAGETGEVSRDKIGL